MICCLFWTPCGKIVEPVGYGRLMRVKNILYRSLQHHCYVHLTSSIHSPYVCVYKWVYIIVKSICYLENLHATCKCQTILCL